MKDYIKTFFKEKFSTSDTSNSKLAKLIESSDNDILNGHDHITGDTCLHMCLQKNLYDELVLMIKKGGNPHIKNKEGESVASLVNKILEKEGVSLPFPQKKLTWKNEAFYSDCISMGNQHKIVFRDEDKENGKIYWSIDFEADNSAHGIPYQVKYLHDEACEIIQRSHKIGSCKTVLKELSDLSDYVRNERENLKKLEQEAKLKEVQSIIEKPETISKTCLEKIRPLLCFILYVIFGFVFNLLLKPVKFFDMKNIIQYQNKWLFLISKFVFCSNLEAKSRNDMNPLQTIIESLGIVEKDVLEAKLDFFLTALCSGAAIYAKTDAEKANIIWIINKKRPDGKFVTCEKIMSLWVYGFEINAQSVQNILFYAADKLQESENHNVNCNGCKRVQEERKIISKNKTESNTECQHVKYEKQLLNCLQYLMKIGCSIEVCDSNGNSLFHKVDVDISFDWLTVLAKNIDTTQAVNSRNSSFQTPLHLAAANGNINFMEYLLKNEEADVNAQDNNLKTPLHYLVQNKAQNKDIYKGYQACKKMLLRHEADSNILDCNMASPFCDEDAMIETNKEENKLKTSGETKAEQFQTSNEFQKTNNPDIGKLSFYHNDHIQTGF